MQRIFLVLILLSNLTAVPVFAKDAFEKDFYNRTARIIIAEEPALGTAKTLAEIKRVTIHAKRIDELRQSQLVGNNPAEQEFLDQSQTAQAIKSEMLDNFTSLINIFQRPSTTLLGKYEAARQIYFVSILNILPVHSLLINIQSYIVKDFSNFENLLRAEKDLDAEKSSSLNKLVEGILERTHEFIIYAVIGNQGNSDIKNSLSLVTWLVKEFNRAEGAPYKVFSDAVLAAFSAQNLKDPKSEDYRLHLQTLDQIAEQLDFVYKDNHFPEAVAKSWLHILKSIQIHESYDEYLSLASIYIKIMKLSKDAKVFAESFESILKLVEANKDKKLTGTDSQNFKITKKQAASAVSVDELSYHMLMQVYRMAQASGFGNLVLQEKLIGLLLAMEPTFQADFEKTVLSRSRRNERYPNERLLNLDYVNWFHYIEEIEQNKNLPESIIAQIRSAESRFLADSTRSSLIEGARALDSVLICSGLF